MRPMPMCWREVGGRTTDDRCQVTGDRRQLTDDRRQLTDDKAVVHLISHFYKAAVSIQLYPFPVVRSLFPVVCSLFPIFRFLS